MAEMGAPSSVVDTDVNGGGAPAVAPEGIAPGGEVDGGAHWSHQLRNADLHNDATLSRYADLDAFADAFMHQRRAISEQTRYPGEDATPEDWQAFYKGVPGYPESADAYDFAPPDMGGNPLSEDELSQTLSRFHGLGLTNSQAEGVLALLAETNAQRTQSVQAADQAHIDAAYDALQALPGWGPLTDRNLSVAMEGIRREFGDEQAWLETLVSAGDNGAMQPLKNIPQFIQMAYQFAQMKGHGRFVPGATNMDSIEGARRAIDQAYQDRREGKITDAERDAILQRHGPLAYSQDVEGVDFARGRGSRGTPQPL